MQVKSVAELPDDVISGKRVLVRVDYNVPVENGKVKEDYRIRASVPTIEHLLSRGARVILISHMGRPKGQRKAEYSLRPVKDVLANMLRAEVIFAEELVGESAEKAIARLDGTKVILMENLRFYPGEEKNDPEFARALARLAEVYVNDAFSTAHRAHASTFGIREFMDIRVAGFSVERELRFLTKVRDDPTHPFAVIIGGAKIRDKLGAMLRLLEKADRFLVGGAISFTFFKAMGEDVGSNPVEDEHVPAVKAALEKFGDKIFLPEDFVMVNEEDENANPFITDKIEQGACARDIGPVTVNKFTSLIRGMKTIFWNGPMGLFEDDRFAEGTVQIARFLALEWWRGATTVVGGGDTIAALRKAEVLENEVTHISTGGGATLLFLSGEMLPGLSILMS